MVVVVVDGVVICQRPWESINGEKISGYVYELSETDELLPLSCLMVGIKPSSLYSLGRLRLWEIGLARGKVVVDESISHG